MTNSAWEQDCAEEQQETGAARLYEIEARIGREDARRVGDALAQAVRARYEFCA